MLGQRRADIANTIDQRLRKLFIPKMLSHQFDHPLPMGLAAFLVNRFIADDSKLVRTRRHEDQNRIALRRLVYSKTGKSFFCDRKRITV